MSDEVKDCLEKKGISAADFMVPYQTLAREKDVWQDFLTNISYYLDDDIPSMGEIPDELKQEYLTPKERIEEQWWRLKLTMDDCGMNTLDSRNAFDWLILYAVSSAEDSMSSRMESVMAALF